MANGLVFITSTGSFTTQSSVSIDGCFSAIYTHYIIKRNLLGSVATAGLNARLRVSSTDDSGANYRDQYLLAGSTSVTGARATGLTSWVDALGYAEATSFGYSETWISNPFDTVRTTAWSDQGYAQTGSLFAESKVYAHDLTTSYDGFTVIPTAGTITGSISVYGLVKA